MKQAQLEKLQSLIDGSHNIVFLGGAGVSTESGIPDFRGKNGLYKQKTAYGSRVTPEYLLSSDCLYHEPELFFDNYRSTGVPKCDCGGMIRPDIVLFGELLPEDYTNARSYMAQADLLIIAGTSLQVLTAVSLIDSFNGAHMVIINDAPTPLDDMAELVIRTPLGEVFSALDA